MRERAIKQTARWLWRRLEGWRLKWTALCAGMALLSLGQVLAALMVRRAVDAGLSGSGRLAELGAALIGLLILLALGRAGLSWLSGETADQMSRRLRLDLLRAVEYGAETRPEEHHSGVLVNRSGEDVRVVCQGAANFLPSQMGGLVRLAAAYGAILWLSPPVAAAAAGAALLAGGAALLLRPAMRRRGEAVRSSEEKAAASLQEYLQQRGLLRALGAEEEALRRYDRELEAWLRASRRRRTLSCLGNGALSASVQGFTGGLLIGGVWSVARGSFSYGELLALVQLAALFRGPALKLSGFWGRWSGMEVSVMRLRQVLEWTPRPAFDGPRAEKSPAYGVFQNVTFRYGPEEEPVLQNFSCRIDLREWTCLTGGSGLGKSTLFKLLLGLLEPQAGDVYLETESGEPLRGERARAALAYVPQDFALFSGSILDNLLLAAPKADRAACRAALEAAQAQFVDRLPQGMDTCLGELKTGLSQGQMQRLAVARAILMDRPVLLMDECTSALDGDTEYRMLHALQALGRGAVLSSHRPEIPRSMGAKEIDLEELL